MTSALTGRLRFVISDIWGLCPACRHCSHAVSTLATMICRLWRTRLGVTLAQDYMHACMHAWYTSNMLLVTLSAAEYMWYMPLSYWVSPTCRWCLVVVGMEACTTKQRGRSPSHLCSTSLQWCPAIWNQTTGVALLTLTLPALYLGSADHTTLR